MPLKTYRLMPALTLKGVPEAVMDRIRELADTERRSLNQQAILLLGRAVAEQPDSFGTAYRRFRARRGAVAPHGRRPRRPT